MQENPLFSEEEFFDPAAEINAMERPGDGDKPKKGTKGKGQGTSPKVQEPKAEVPAWAQGKTVADLPQAPAPKKPRKKRDFSAQEKAMLNYRDNENIVNRSPNTSSGTGGVSPMYLVQIEQDRVKAKSMQKELKETADFYNAQNADYVQDFIDTHFGGVEDILNGGEKLNGFLINTSNGLQISDEAIKRLLDTEVRAQGGGNYTSTLYFGQIKGVANQLLGLWNQRDAANKELKALKEKYSGKAYENVLLTQQQNLLNEGKTKIAAERQLSDEKLVKIQQQYEPVIADLGMDLSFYLSQTAEEVSAAVLKEMEGVTGVSPVYVKNKMEEAINTEFLNRYGSYIEDNVRPVVDAYVGAVNEEIGKVNKAVGRIVNQQQASFTKYRNSIVQQSEQDRNKADDEAAAIIDKYIQLGTERQRTGQKVNTAIRMVQSGLSMGPANPFLGKIFGDSFMAGLGRLRTNTATFLKSVGAEGSWIDEMQYGGMNQQQRYSVGDASLAEFGLTPGFWAKALGESAPTMLPGILISALTKNPQVGMIISGVMEGSDLAGGITNQVAEETGDWGQAAVKGREAFLMNIPTYFLEAPVHRLAAGIAGRTGKGLLLNVGTAGLSGGAQEWLQTGAIELPATENVSIAEGMTDPKAAEAGLTGMGMEMMMGSAGAALNTILTKVPNARTQIITNSIVRHGTKGAIGAAQQEALGENATELQNNIAEIGKVANMLDDAKVLQLPVPETQVYTAFREELTGLEEKKAQVKDPVLQEVVQKQVEEKKQQIEQLVRGEEKLATIELPMGLVFTGTAPQIGEILQQEDIIEGVKNGSIVVSSEDSKLMQQVEGLRQKEETNTAGSQEPVVDSNTVEPGQYDDLLDAIVVSLPDVQGLYGRFLEQVTDPEQQEFVAQAVIDQYEQDFDAASERYGEKITEAVKPLLSTKQPESKNSEVIEESRNSDNVEDAQQPQQESVENKQQMWYRGVNSKNKEQGDRFYSASESVAADYAIDKVGDTPTMTTLSQEEMPSNPLTVGDKTELAEMMGLDEQDVYDLGFDDKAKAFAQQKGYDAILYESGSMDEPELHVFQKQQQPKKPQKSAKPKKVKLTYRQRTNNLIEKIQKAENITNKTERAKVFNEIKTEVAAINKAFPKAGYKFDQKGVRLLSANGKRVVKRNEVTNSVAAKDFDAANYSEATTRYVQQIANDETLATGLAMTGVDGRRLSVEQMQQTLQSIRDGKITEAGRELYDYIEQSVNNGFVEIEDGGMRAKVSIEDYFAAAQQVEELYTAGELPMSEAEILNWLAEEAANDYEETNFDNVENLPEYEQDITTTGSEFEQQPETESGAGQSTGGQEGANTDEAPPADGADAGAEEQRQAFLDKTAKDFDTYNRLPKNKRSQKLNAMSRRLAAARRDGVITEEDYTDIAGRINADYAALGSDVRAEQLSVPDDLMDAFEGEGEDARITNSEKAKEVADKIRALRIKNDKLYGGFLGLPVSVYNGFLTTIANLVEAGGSIADMIKAGVEYVKANSDRNDADELKRAVVAELQNLGMVPRKRTATPRQAIAQQYKSSPKTGTTTLRELFKRRVKAEKDMGKLLNELQQAVTDIFSATIGTDLSKGRVAKVMEALQGLTNLQDTELALLDVIEEVELIVREQQNADLVREVNSNLKKLEKQFKRSGTLTERYKNFYKSLHFPRARKVILATGAATLQQYNDLLSELASATSAKQFMRENTMEQVQNKLNELNKLIAEYEQQRLYDKIEIMAKKGLFTPVLVNGTIDMEQSAEKYLAEREAEGSTLEEKAAKTKENVLRNYLPELQQEVSKEIENIEDKRLQKETAELVKVDVSKLDAAELSELNDLLNNVLLDHAPDGIGNFLARVDARADMGKIVSKAKDMVVRPVNKETLEKKSLNALFQSLFYNEKAWSYFRSIVYQPWATAANKVKAVMNGDKRREGIAEQAEKIVKKHKLKSMQFYRTEMYKFINRYNPAFPESREEQQQAAVEKLAGQVAAIYQEGVRNMNGQKETFESKKLKTEALLQAEAAKSLGVINSYTETADGLTIEANETYSNDAANLTEGEKAWVDFTYKQFEKIADDAEYSARSNFGQDFQREEAYTPFIPLRLAIDNNAAADAKVDGSISTFTDFGKKLSKQPTDRFKKRGRLAGDEYYYGMNGLENFYNGIYQTLFAIEGGRELIQTTSIINGTEFAKFVNGSYNPIFGEKNFGRGEQAELIRSKLSQVYKGYKYAPFKFTTMQDYESTVGQWVYSKMLETMVSSIDQIFKQPLPGMVQGTIDIGPKYMAHALRIIMSSLSSKEQADKLNQFFDNTSEEFRDAQSLDSFHKVVDEENRPAWQHIASVPFNVFNFAGKKALVWADKKVLNRVLLMAGYLKGLEQNGRLTNLSDFDVAAEAGEPDMLALSTAESAAQRINATSAKQEKADVVKMGQGKNWWDFGFTLRGFQLDAWNNFRNNLRIAFDRSGYLGATDPDRFAALRRASAYLAQSAAYQSLVIWGTGMAWTALGQLAAEALMGAAPPPDEDKEKEKQTRRVLRMGSNIIADAFLGGQSVYVDAGVKVMANKLWEGYQDLYKDVDGGKPKDYKGGILDSRMKPFYVEESQAAGPMAALRYIEGFGDAVKTTKTTGMDPKAIELKDRLERVQLALLLLNAGDLQKLNNYTIKALNEYGKSKANKQSGLRQNGMKWMMLKPPKL